MTLDIKQKILHSSCVVVRTSGVLILGPSGSGKSSLALRLIGLGGTLISDDRTVLTHRNKHIIATCPKPIQGRIEARGVGIIKLIPKNCAKISLVVDMGSEGIGRLPKNEKYNLFGVDIPLIRSAPLDAFAEAIYCSVIGSLGRE